MPLYSFCEWKRKEESLLHFILILTLLSEQDIKWKSWICRLHGVVSNNYFLKYFSLNRRWDSFQHSWTILECSKLAQACAGQIYMVCIISFILFCCIQFIGFVHFNNSSVSKSNIFFKVSTVPAFAAVIAF